MAQNNQTNSPFPTAINKGGTGVSSVTSAPTASAWAGWDANKNLSATGFIPGYSTTATAAGTTTLTVGSNQQQYFTGSTTQTVVMPVANTCVVGQYWNIVNNSTGAVTIQSSGLNTILVLPASSETIVTCVLASGTTAASWVTSPAVSGSGTVSSGLINQLAYYAAAGTTVSGVTIVNSAALTTTAGGVPTWVAYTGSGSPVLATSPTLITPTLGAATATSLAFSPTTGGIIGTTAADNAGAGKVGEFISSVIAQASAVSFSTGTPKNITSISLTAGDWDVWGNGYIIPSLPTITQAIFWISSTSATVPDGSLISILGEPSGTPFSFCALPAPQQRFNVSGSTTVYISVQATFATGTATACGGIYARRVR